MLRCTAGKSRLAVLEVVEAGNAASGGDGVEERLGGVVGGDAGGLTCRPSGKVGAGETALLAPATDQLGNGLGKQGVEIDVADAGEREALAVVGEQAGAFRAALGHDEVAVEALVRRAGVGGIECLDQPGAGRRIGGGGDLGTARAEELLFLQLDALPRRIGQHDIEAALREHLGEGQPPVEEVVFLGQFARSVRPRRRASAGLRRRAPDRRKVALWWR